MIESIGWLGGLLFAFCGLPQAIQCYRQGHSRGTNSLFIWMWFAGEILMQIYVLVKHGLDLPLLVNYWINTIFVLIIIKFKYWERDESNS